MFFRAFLNSTSQNETAVSHYSLLPELFKLFITRYASALSSMEDFRQWIEAGFVFIWHHAWYLPERY